MLVAIDGPAGAGKSTVARALAERLGYTYLDSGAMYRCVALLSLEAPGTRPAALAQRARIELGERILLDGRDVSEAIRAPEVSEAASRVAADPGVRTALVASQRALIAAGLEPEHRRFLAYAVVGMAEGASRHWVAARAERAAGGDDGAAGEEGAVGEDPAVETRHLAGQLADLAWAGLRSVHAG